MTRRYRYTTSIEFGGDEPTAVFDDVVVEYSVAAGSPETGRFGPPENYDSGSSPEVEDMRVISVDGVSWDNMAFLGGGTRSDWHEGLCDKITADCWDALLENAVGMDEYDRDEAAETRRATFLETVARDEISVRAWKIGG